MAVCQAKAGVNQTGNLLWTADLPGVATDASVTPVVISAASSWGGIWSFANSGATFSGNASAYPGSVMTGPKAGSVAPASGWSSTTNYMLSSRGGSVTMTAPKQESYLGFLTAAGPFNVTLYNGGTSLGTITAAQLSSAALADGYAWINIDVASGGTYTSAVFSETTPTADSDRVYFISYGTASESLGAAPLPALAGTLPGLTAALLGMLGLRRRGGRRA